MKNTVLTSLSLVLVGEDVICEGFSPLCIWVSDKMVPILLRVLCSSGHVKVKEVGVHLGFLWEMGPRHFFHGWTYSEFGCKAIGGGWG